MKLVIEKNRSVTSVGTWGTKNENNYEILEFEFPQELEEYNKRIVYYLDDEKVWDIILDNKVYITNAVTKYERVKGYVWLTKGEEITLKYVCTGDEEGNYYFAYDENVYYFTMPEVQANDELIFDVATEKLKLNDTEIQTSSTGTGTELTFSTEINAAEDFRTKLFEMNFYENENADGLIPTQEEVDGFNTMLTAMNNAITEVDDKIDEIDEIVDSKIDEIDTKIDEVDEAVTGIENLNIDVSDKVDGDVTVTLTKKNGTTKTVVLSDGTSLMFHWDGTRLGIKTDKDAEYVYVDLKGAKGDTGPQGEPGAIKFIIVQQLPTTDIETDAIYLVPITPDEGDNNYAEYIYVNNQWELLGKIGVHVDLSGYQPLIDSTHKLASDLVDDSSSTNKFTTTNEKNSWNAKYDKPSGGIPSTDLADEYVKPTDYATTSKGGVIKTSSNVANEINNNGILIASNRSYEQYSNASNSMFVSKGTLENVITGKGLVSNADYATSSTGGVIKSNGNYATAVNSSGVFYATTKSYSDYSNLTNGAFIGKGTLENVLNAVVGDISSALDSINGEVV